MKIKPYSILLGIGLFLSWTGGAFAGWYGNHPVGYSNPGGATLTPQAFPSGPNQGTPCGGDAQPDSAGSPPSPQYAVSQNNSPMTLIPHGTSSMTVAPSGTMYCLYWDSTNPLATSVTYYTGWTNDTTIDITMNGSDYGGSGIKNYTLEYRTSTNGTAFTLWSGWMPLTTTPSSTYIFSVPGSPSTAYQFRFYITDGANNKSPWQYGTATYMLDTVAPNSNELSSITPSNLLATNFQAFSFAYANSDRGSPIQLTSIIENYNNPAGFLTRFNPSTGFTYGPFTDNGANISLVDNQRTSDGNAARQYTYRITRIRDQAGNIWNGTKDFSYNIYANPNSTVANTQNYTSNTIADGQPSTFTHAIKDQWNNAIIPASGISRTVSQNLTGISNTMYLDQYLRTGGTSVFMTPTTGTEVGLATTSPQNLGNQNSTTGSYPIAIKVYTPTANSYLSTDPISDPNAGFGFTSNLQVNDTLIGAPKTFVQSLPTPNFRPLYTTQISGNLRMGGFIEGAFQDSTIGITNNNSSVTPSSNALQLEFGGTDSSKFTLQANSTTNPTTVIGAHATMIANPMSPILGSTHLYSFLKQNPNLIGNLSNLYLSTHFSYTLDGHNILYNSDIIGKTQYHTGSTGNIGTQYGVKILGAVSSNVAQAITIGQFASTTSIFGGINRATIRNNANKSITVATRNMTLSGITGSPTLSSINTLPGAGGGGLGGIVSQDSNSSIMKIVQSGGMITLGNGSDLSIAGKRSLVIVGANLYIRSNMYYTTKDSILGIMVQKDTNGNGGNIYIDPSLTNIVGAYIIDGSFQSYDGTSVLGVSNISALKNQLYIYGSMVSENTIGGSRMSPFRCPSLLNTGCASIDEAQKYDLNFLRRYYLYNNAPFGNGKVTGGETCTAASCTNTNTNLVQKFTNTTADLAKYPVIIERNPLIVVSPPPGFDTQIE